MEARFHVKKYAGTWLWPSHSLHVLDGADPLLFSCPHLSPTTVYCLPFFFFSLSSSLFVFELDLFLGCIFDKEGSESQMHAQQEFKEPWDRVLQRDYLVCSSFVQLIDSIMELDDTEPSAQTTEPSPGSQLLLDILVSRALCLAITAPETPEFDFDSLDYTHTNQHAIYDWADHLDLASIPTEIFHQVLDRLFFMGTEYPHLTCASIHALHVMRSSCKPICDKIHSWIKRNEVQDFLQMVRDDIVVRGHIQFARSNLKKHQIHTQNTMAYDCASNCLECLKFLIDLGLAKPHLYDETRRSFLHAAINHECDEVLDHLLKTLTPPQIDATTDMSLGYLDGHPLMQLAIARNQRGFEKVLERLLGHFDAATFFSNKKLKLYLCTFVSPEFAERLYAMGYNIGNVTGRSTSWHAAVQGNAHGSSFLEWLQNRSGSGPDILDAAGHNLLMHAATGDRATSIQWLCSYIDPMSRWVNPDDPSDHTQPAFALTLAACSVTEESIQIFRGIMLRLPRSFFEDRSNSVKVFETICDALVEHRKTLSVPRPGTMRQLQWQQAWRGAVNKCYFLSDYLLKTVLPRGTWHPSPEMRALCVYVRERDLPMLVHGIVPVPPQAKSWIRWFKKRESGAGRGTLLPW